MNNDIGQLDLRILGQTTEEIEVAAIDELRAISLDFALQCQRNLQIISRHLDQNLYDNNGFIQAVKNLAKRSRYSNIQILVHDSTPAVKSNHKLITLHQQLSSYIHIRKISNEYNHFNHALVLADQTGYIFRQFADRFTATVNYNHPLETKKLAETFTEIWEVSAPDPQVRRLSL